MTEPLDAPAGLRERKKRESARAIESAAVDLAYEHGLAEVTVEAIAAAADVTSRTFFNYFASKEDAVLGNSRAFPPPSLGSVSWVPGRSVRSQVLDAVGAQVAAFDLVSPDLLEKKRAVVAANPQLLAKDFQSLGTIEADFAREVERLLTEEGEVPAGERADRAWAIVISIGAVLRLSMHTWSGSGGRELSLAEHITRADALLSRLS